MPQDSLFGNVGREEPHALSSTQQAEGRVRNGSSLPLCGYTFKDEIFHNNELLRSFRVVLLKLYLFEGFHSKQRRQETR